VAPAASVEDEVLRLCLRRRPFNKVYPELAEALSGVEGVAEWVQGRLGGEAIRTKEFEID
jgi:hypothetical protein